jgi:hypothetical protein
MVFVFTFFIRIIDKLPGQVYLGFPLVQKILSWRHIGFNVHSQVRAQTKSEADRVGTYMIRPLLSSKRLFFNEKAGKVRYQESMDYLDFIARVTSHIPDEGQVMIRYYGLYSNAHRGRCVRLRLILLIAPLLKMIRAMCLPRAGPR